MRNRGAFTLSLPRQKYLGTSLGLEARLKGSPWYVPSRGRATAAGETTREGESYMQNRSLDPARRAALPASRFGAETGRISHSERIELENSVLIADRNETADSTVVPLMTVSRYLSLEFDLKTIGGIEETITAGSSDYQPALGFELRLTAILSF